MATVVSPTDTQSTSRRRGHVGADARSGSPAPRTTSQTRVRHDRQLIFTILIGAVVLAGFFASPIVRRRVSVHGDLGMHFLPVKGLYAECLRRGESFDWMPQLFGGYFLTGEGQHGPYHPAHWVMYRLLPVDVAFSIEVFLPVVVLGAGTVVFLLRYVNLAGACLGGLLAAFSLNFVVHLQQPCVSMIMAHTPWLLAAVDLAVKATDSRQRRLACVAIALLVGSLILLGHPQSAWFTLLAGSTFGLFMLVARRGGWPQWAAVTGGFVIGIALGAVQLLSTYELLQTTDRSMADLSTLPYPAIEPQAFLEVLAPFKQWKAIFPTYCGVVPMLLVVWWCTAHRLRPQPTRTTPNDAESLISGDDQGRRTDVLQLTLWAVAFALLTAILSLGLKGKLYALQMQLPLVGSFRGPSRYLMLTQICVALLAGVAFARLTSLCRRGQRVPWAHLAMPWLAVAVSATLSLLAYWVGDYSPRESRVQGLLVTGPLLFAAAAVALTLAARGRPIGLLLLAGLAAIDLGAYSVGSSYYGKAYWRQLPTYQEWLASLPLPPDSTSGRICHEGNTGDILKRVNPYLLLGYRASNGNAGLYVSRQLDYRHINTLRVAETAWYWQPGDDAQRVAGLVPPPGGGWCRVPDPVPRARLVSDVQLSSRPGDDLKRIDVATTALVARPLDLPASEPGTVEIVEDRPGRIALEADAPSDQLLALSESYHRSWQIRLDGEPADLEQVNGDFIGCVVPAGRHRVEFDFRCASLQRGKAISLLALLLAIAVGVGAPGDWLRRRAGDAQTTNL